MKDRKRLKDLKLLIDTLRSAQALHDDVAEYTPETPNETTRNHKLVSDMGDLGCRICEIINEETQRFLDATEPPPDRTTRWIGGD